MGMHIEKIVVILDVNASYVERSVVVLLFGNTNSLFRLKQSIGTPLFTIEPNIDISIRSMVRSWIAQTQTVAFQYHHRNAVGCIKSGQTSKRL